jgi:hypothetical protein
MWLLRASRPDDREGNNSSFSKSSSIRSGFGRRKRKQKPPTKDHTVETTTTMHFSESYSGIEVSLSHDRVWKNVLMNGNNNHDNKNKNGRKTPLIDYSHQTVEASLIHRRQFQSLLKYETDTIEPSSSTFLEISNALSPSSHRIPLFLASLKNENKMLFDDVLFLLRSHEITNERELIKDELQNLEHELAQIENDRREIEKFQSRQIASNSPPRNTQQRNNKNNPLLLSEINQHLALTTIAGPEKRQLQQQRGNSLTVCISNAKTREIFLSKCGYSGPRKSNVYSISRNNCREGGAAATMRHVQFLPPYQASSHARSSPSSSSNVFSKSHGSFLIARDHSNSFHLGRLPDRLFRRIQSSNHSTTDPNKLLNNLAYLSANENSYYAEFKSGEIWWGVDDPQLDTILRQWDIVVMEFGETRLIGKRRFSTWIAVDARGRVAWKNLPARLHGILESRLPNASGIASVSLGARSSWFIKFVDGETHWMLPAQTAKAFETLEKEQRSVTSVSLHPKLPNDFIIRHC